MFIFNRKYLHLIMVSDHERDNLLIGCVLAKVKSKDITMRKMCLHGYIFQLICNKKQYEIIKKYCAFTEVEAK